MKRTFGAAYPADRAAGLAGEPHVHETRVPTAAVAALVRRGFATTQAVKLYADVSEQSILEAVDLEDQIRRTAESIAA